MPLNSVRASARGLARCLGLPLNSQRPRDDVMGTNVDALVMGNPILDKRDQPELVEDFDWRERYELD